jgi:methionine synthase I (cobalamin-dependent)
LAYEKHKGHIQALARAGVDALLFETAVKLEEIK